MPSGVKRSPEETDELKRKIVEHLAGGIGRTFYGTCQSLGVGVSEAYEWQAEDPWFKGEVARSRKQTINSAVDLAESKLVAKIQNEDITAIIFFLKTQGKARGYVEKSISELVGPDGMPLQPPSLTLAFTDEPDEPTPAN